jgi:hypothetical protein
MTSNRVASLDGYFRDIEPRNFLLLKSGLFKQKPRPLHDIGFRVDQGVLRVIESNSTGAPSSKSKLQPSKIHLFRMNSHKDGNSLEASDIQGYATVDEQLMLKTENELIFEKLETLSGNHDATEERHMSSLLQGKMLNTDGTVLLDIYKEFGLDRSDYTIDFDLANSAVKINDKMNALTDGMTDNLSGERMTGITVYSTPKFLAKLINNADLRDLLKQSPSAQLLMQDFNNGKGLRIPGFDDVVFKKYKEVIGGIDYFPDSADGFAFAIPDGTLDTFVMYRGPAMRLTTVNKMPVGNGRYTLIQRKTDDTGLTIDTESVFLPIMKRPKLLWQLVG